MITEDRLHHMLGVARKAYEIAKLLGYSEDECKKYFAIGLNHDIGYEFDNLTHEEIGGKIFEEWELASRAIRTHGNTKYPLSTDWIIINLADMTTSPTGKPITMTDRLQDIENRFGNTHEWYLDAKKVCDKLIENVLLEFLKEHNYI